MIRCPSCGATDEPMWPGHAYQQSFSKVYANPTLHVPCARVECKRDDAHLACSCNQCAMRFCADLPAESTIHK